MSIRWSRHAVHLKEDRKIGDSAVAQAFSAVCFYHEERRQYPHLKEAGGRAATGGVDIVRMREQQRQRAG